MIGAMILYMILHELVHGVAMKICGTKKVKYGFTGMYAFAGSEDLYDKKSYIFVALAPVVFWGVVLLIINLFVPLGWFWVVYLIQIANISGAAGDFFVTVKFLKMPRDILVQDYGVGMTVYSKEEIEFIIFHQFCHLKYKTHCNKFQEMVKKHIPKYKQYEEILKEIKF